MPAQELRRVARVQTIPILVCLGIACVLARSAHAQRDSALVAQAEAAYQKRDFERAAALYAQAVDRGYGDLRTLYSAACCTKRDTYPDGRELVGIGVQPAQQVRPTVEDIRAGRDAVLEAAQRSLQRR